VEPEGKKERVGGGVALLLSKKNRKEKGRWRVLTGTQFKSVDGDSQRVGKHGDDEAHPRGTTSGERPGVC